MFHLSATQMHKHENTNKDTDTLNVSKQTATKITNVTMTASIDQHIL